MANKTRTPELCLDLDNLTSFPFYKHNALPGEESIRLIRLTDIPLLFGVREIQKLCTIETFTMQEAPGYLALSYTWGAPLLDDTSKQEYSELSLWLIASSIPENNVDGVSNIPTLSTVEIGTNLQRALLYFSQVPPKIYPYIWIDALCIDQKDQTERAQQVARMMDIYSACVMTVVWLGNDAPHGADVTNLWELHEDLYPALMTHYYDKDHLPDRHVPGWTIENMYQRLHLEHKKERHDWMGYVQFSNERTWFSRTWVFQEFALSPLIFYICAGLTFEPEYLAAVAQFLRCTSLGFELIMSKWSMKIGETFAGPWIQLDQAYRTRLQLRDIGTSTWLRRIAATCMTDSSTHRIAAYTFWAYTLVEIRSSDAKDKLDKIYATYGILQKALSAVSLTPDPRLFPDYDRSVTQLYTNTMLVLLTEVADLTFLSEVQDPSLTIVQGLPSWVPDFSVRRHQSLFMDHLFAQYNASGCKSPREEAKNILILTSPVPRIVLKGFAVSAIKQCCDVIPVSSTACLHLSSVESQTRLFELWKRLLESITNYGRCSRWKLLLRTLVAGHKKSHYLAPVKAKYFKAFVTWWMIQQYEEKASTLSHEARIQDLDWAIISQSSDGDPKYIPSRGMVQRALLIYHLSKTDPRLVTSADVAPINSALQDARTLNGLVGRYGINRVLFATANGLLGLGPRSMRPGDEVWLVEEARTLFTVRRTDFGDYTLLGETYVYRCMNGELTKYAEGWWKDLVLR